ncbi:hypothetical protein ABZ318_07365 [Streptomyces sp. NPDC006197]|uniref:hypothetical protein n=1 Tax=Streptomyces sp. NPDC006197 TaxID=3156685 RepID=UPI0033A41159
MNLTTTRTLLAALAVTGALLGSTGAAHAAGALSAPASAVTAVAPMDGPEPVELDELGLPDLLED